MITVKVVRKVRDALGGSTEGLVLLGHGVAIHLKRKPGTDNDKTNDKRDRCHQKVLV